MPTYRTDVLGIGYPRRSPWFEREDLSRRRRAGAKFWLGVLTEIKNRGVEDVGIVVCDEIKGLPESITATWEYAVAQTRSTHLIRTPSSTPHPGIDPRSQRTVGRSNGADRGRSSCDLRRVHRKVVHPVFRDPYAVEERAAPNGFAITFECRIR